MNTKTSSEAINREALLFGLMVGIIATTAMTLLGDFNFLIAALAGGVLAIVVWFVVTRLGKELPPARGEGNVAPDAKPSPPPAAAKRVMPEPVVASPALQPGPLGSAPATTEAPAHERPTSLPSARDGGADDLKKIKGVGPKLEELLHSMGIYHFDQIADWTPDHVAWMDDNLEGFKGRVSRDDWIGQARSFIAN